MRILGVALAVLVLAGCSATPPVEPVETLEPQVEPIDIPAPPILVFEGSCANALDVSALSATLGGAWTASGHFDKEVAPYSYLLDNVGGIECFWGSDDGQGLSAVVLPVDAVTAAEDTKCGFATDQGAASCAVDVTANGMRLAGLYTRGEGDPNALRATAASIEALFIATAVDAVAVSAPAADPDFWLSAPDCPLIELLGIPIYNEVLGTDVYMSAPMIELQGGSAMAMCSLKSDQFRYPVSFTILSGGRWMEAAVRAQEGAEVIKVDGIELVILVPVSENSFYVNVFDGPNWLQTSKDDSDTLYPLLADLVAALNQS